MHSEKTAQKRDRIRKVALTFYKKQKQTKPKMPREKRMLKLRNIFNLWRFVKFYSEFTC